jgi:glycosyltransferase involved in cell wall biosynthesis
MFSFVWRLFLKSNEITKQVCPDIVIASSTYPLDIYPARRIARASGAKLVFEVHDLWPLSPMELGNMKPWHPFIMGLQVAENSAYRSVDRVISMLPNAKAHMITHGMAPEKFSFVPNGINVQEWDPMQRQPLPEEHASLINELRRQGLFLVGYAGGHGLSNALGQIINAAALLKGEKVRFILVGKGPEKERLIAEAKRRGVNNVLFLPPIAKPSVPTFLAEMDILYLGWTRNPLYRFGICPNKLMDYMMAAKPIVHAVEAANDLVADSQCGISIMPEDPEAIAEAIKHMMALTAEEKKAMGQRGQDYVLHHHDYKLLAKYFLECLESNEKSI